MCRLKVTFNEITIDVSALHFKCDKKSYLFKNDKIYFQFSKFVKIRVERISTPP